MEGLPNVVLEAMAHGKTVIATPVGGIPSVIEDGKTGFLVPVGDAVALRATIKRVLADDELRKRVGEAARARVSEYCSWDRVTERRCRSTPTPRDIAAAHRRRAPGFGADGSCMWLGGYRLPVVSNAHNGPRRPAG